jgi:hypothetical protein
MDELINTIAEKVGIEKDVASKAVGILLNFLRKEGPDDAVSNLFGSIDGAEAMAMQAEANAGGGGLFGAFGGGLMAVMGQLQGAGLGMGDIQAVTKETVNFAKEKAGAETVDAVLAKIPGVSQFV